LAEKIVGGLVIEGEQFVLVEVDVAQERARAGSRGPEKG
jgi:hypothetical protein